MIARLAALALVVAAGAARAQDSQTFDGFTVHYNAVNADFVAKDAAKQFGISRAPNRALLNVSVLLADYKQSEAEVSGTVSGVRGNHPLQFRPIREDGSVYYVAEFEIGRGESNYTFELTVKRAGAPRAYPIAFNQTLVGP